MTYRKKLIEVALPLEAINMESAREKSIRHGHPSTLHLWWARRPLAACRAVLWSSLVDDPSSWPDRFPTEEDQTRERQRLFDILGRITIEETRSSTKQVVRGLVSWDDIKDPAVIEEAQREIARSLAWGRGEEPPTKPDAVREYIARYAPPVYDPFAGGGSIPLEAQRLGLEAHASDLNPVAVLINKALIEIPPKFKDMPPVNPEDRKRAKLESWKGAQGLAADVRYYGKWMRDEAFKRIGHLYPKVKVVREQDGSYRHATEAEIADPKAKVEELTVIAWIWARTVKCPNPACNLHMPMISSFVLASKKGKEKYLNPALDSSDVDFSISNKPPTKYPKANKGLKRGTSGVFECVACETITTRDYVALEAKAGKLDVVPTAVVAEGQGERIYLSGEKVSVEDDLSIPDLPSLNAELAANPRDVWCRNFGLETPKDLFTEKQLKTLTTLCEILNTSIPNQVKKDFGVISDASLSEVEQYNFNEYVKAIKTLLSFVISKVAESCSALCTWSSSPKNELVVSTFRRQALPMVWDFAEANPFGMSSGSIEKISKAVAKVVEGLPTNNSGFSRQHNATLDTSTHQESIVSTDPPYYDNIGYADLSDFFYVWLRNSVGDEYQNIFKTLLTPKSDELVAIPYRFSGDSERANVFFESGLEKVFRQINEHSATRFPLTIYYAFKQAESLTSTENLGTSITTSTGWETMLEGLMRADFSITGTWPIRTERSARSVSIGTNALASSIVLVCRPRPTDAPKATRRQFLNELKRELPKALKTLQQGNIAPVDLAQASIGPGMAVFSKYAAVLESDGTPMRVRTALQLINQILDEFLAEQEGEFDRDTRWALTWFEQHQYADGPYGEAETLSTARNTSVKGMEEAGILIAKGGKVRLLKRDELPQDWQPEADNRTPDWEATQYLIHTLLNQGELAAAELLARLGAQGENARDLAYRLYTICDRKGWAAEGVAYNSLVIAWPEISRLASETERATPVQGTLGV